MRRLMLYDRLGNTLGELAENDVFEAVLREEINGEHSLTITTTQVLEKGIRLLYQDGRGKWREFAVAGIDAEHASGNRAIGTYYCVWSVQEDLQGVTVSVMPGVQNPTPAGTALTSLLSSQSRWARGTVTNTATGGASMYDRSAWEALSVLVEVWGGEVDATITTGTQSGVTGRAVDLYTKQGNQTALRRFDFAHDLQSVKRTLPDTPFYCRISPRGAGEETDAGGHGRKITIESVNSGKDYLEYSPMVDVAKLPNGSGYIYPTLIVENSNCKTPTELKTWAQSVLTEYCVPKVTYEIDVLQAGIEGVDFTGVSLGDAVQVVDRKFSPEGIRIEGRVRSITTDLLNERDISIVIGDAVESVSSKFAKVDKSLSTIGNDITIMSTAEYITNLLDRINTEINATGGYTYITEGQGIRTYDTAVSDPLVGSEASAVVEIKGGTIRIANSKTAQGAWNWRSVFTSGHITADLVTAANLTAGYIGSAGSGNYWNLDTGDFRMAAANVNVGTQTLSQYIANNTGLDQTKVFNLLTNNGALQGLYMSGGELYVNASYIKTGYISATRIQGGTLKLGGGSNGNGVLEVYDSSNTKIGTINNAGANLSGQIVLELTRSNGSANVTSKTQAGYVSTADSSKYWNLTGGTSGGVTRYLVGLKTEEYLSDGTLAGRLMLLPIASDNNRWNTLTSNRSLMLISKEGAPSACAWIMLRNNTAIDMGVNTDPTTATGPVRLTNTALTVGTTTKAINTTFRGNLTVNSSYTKSKAADTENYNTRLLYCDETPSPMFTDIGGGMTDDSGECVVMVDPIFSETARTDLAYHVFLQPCGEGALYVAEKSAWYFVVRGTPNIAFDWQLKAKQNGFESDRLEDIDIRDECDVMGECDESVLGAYAEELEMVAAIERALYDED